MLKSRTAKPLGAATLRDLAAVLVRITGIWALVGAALFVSGALASLNGYRSATSWHIGWVLAGYVLAALVQAIVGVVLVTGADAIARRVAPRAAPVGLTVSADDLRRIAFCLLALYFVYEALPGIASVFYRLWETRMAASMPGNWTGSSLVWEPAVSVVVRLAFAGWLWRQSQRLGSGPAETDEGEGRETD